MSAKYLKDLVASGPKIITIISIGEEFTNPRGKEVRKITFQVQGGGEMSEDLLAVSFKYDLKGATAGSNYTAFINDKGYLSFKKTAQQPAPAIAGNAGIDRDLWISHQGFMNAHINAGRNNQEALELALEAYKLLKQGLSSL